MKYDYNSNIQITQHFNSKEFRCKCSNPHEFTVIEQLPEKLEALYTKLSKSKFGCSRIIITSGYRCSNHDKAVGGTGSGKHTEGYAADIICYGADGKAIESKYICCVAQDVGFPAVAKIDNTAVHVDVRFFGGWYGDETVTTNYSVTQDFYDYFNISPNDIYPKSGDVTTSTTISYKMNEVSSITITGDEVILILNGTSK